MNRKIINIEGMQCDHCKMRVEKVLSELDGVKNVTVSLEDKNAIIEFEGNIENDTIKNSIEDIGFNVIKID